MPSHPDDVSTTDTEDQIDANRATTSNVSQPPGETLSEAKREDGHHDEEREPIMTLAGASDLPEGILPAEPDDDPEDPDPSPSGNAMAGTEAADAVDEDVAFFASLGEDAEGADPLAEPAPEEGLNSTPQDNEMSASIVSDDATASQDAEGGMQAMNAEMTTPRTKEQELGRAMGMVRDRFQKWDRTHHAYNHMIGRLYEESKLIDGDVELKSILCGQVKLDQEAPKPWKKKVAEKSSAALLLGLLLGYEKDSSGTKSQIQTALKAADHFGIEADEEQCAKWLADVGGVSGARRKLADANKANPAPKPSVAEVMADALGDIKRPCIALPSGTKFKDSFLMLMFKETDTPDEGEIIGEVTDEKLRIAAARAVAQAQPADEETVKSNRVKMAKLHGTRNPWGLADKWNGGHNLDRFQGFQ